MELCKTSWRRLVFLVLAPTIIGLTLVLCLAYIGPLLIHCADRGVADTWLLVLRLLGLN